jgi:hypothetical protein
VTHAYTVRPNKVALEFVAVANDTTAKLQDPSASHVSWIDGVAESPLSVFSHFDLENRVKGTLIFDNVPIAKQLSFTYGVSGHNVIDLRLEPLVLSLSWVGCYMEDADHDLDGGPHEYGYGPETCAIACRNYTYMALQSNGWCSCGNSYATQAQYRATPSSECGTICAGEASLSPKRYCGSSLRNAIYLVEEVPHMSWVGCYVDDESHDLDAGPQSTGYTSETCALACRNFSYFALQDTGYCSCGDAYGTNSQYVQVQDHECGRVCDGEEDLSPTRFCGGGPRNMVYRLTDAVVPTIAWVGCFVADSSDNLPFGPHAYDTRVHYVPQLANTLCTWLCKTTASAHVGRATSLRPNLLLSPTVNVAILVKAKEG